MAEKRKATGFSWRSINQREHLEELGVYGRIILILSLRKYDGRTCIGLICLRTVKSCGLL